MIDRILTIPILLDHWHEDRVGMLTARPDGLFFEFKEGISRDALFDTFGNAGIRMTVIDDMATIKSGQILEFSLSSPLDTSRPTNPGKRLTK